MGQIVEDIAGLWDREHKIRRKHKRRCQRRRKSIKQKNKGNRGEEQRRKRGNWQTGCAAGERERTSLLIVYCDLLMISAAVFTSSRLSPPPTETLEAPSGSWGVH